MKSVKPRIVIVTDNPHWQQSEAARTPDYELVFTDFASLTNMLTSGRVADGFIIASHMDEPGAELRNSILLARQIGVTAAWANPDAGLTPVLEEMNQALSENAKDSANYWETLAAQHPHFLLPEHGVLEDKIEIPKKDWRSVRPQAADGGRSDPHHAKPPRINSFGPPRTRS